MNRYTIEEVRAIKAEARKIGHGLYGMCVADAARNLYGGAMGERHTYQSILKMLYYARKGLLR